MGLLIDHICRTYAPSAKFETFNVLITSSILVYFRALIHFHFVSLYTLTQCIYYVIVIQGQPARRSGFQWFFNFPKVLFSETVVEKRYIRVAYSGAQEQQGELRVNHWQKPERYVL